MEFLFSLVAIVLSIIAISRTNDTSIKIANLEKKMNEVGDDAKQQTVMYSSSELISSLEDKDFSTTKNLSPETQIEEYKESGFITWLKEDWLLKLGGILVLMGVLFFLSLAFTAVGPQGKVAIGYIFGISLMLFGFNYAKKQIIGGSAIHVIGAVVIIITTYLARQPEYNLFDPYFATLLMFLTTVVVALTAYIYNRAQLAHVGLFLAAIVPLLTNTESNDFLGLLMYLGIVTLGVLWLALVTKWRTLVLLALTIVCVYSAMKINGSMNGSIISLAESYLVVVFGVLFYVTSLFSILRSQGATQPADGAVALLNAGYALLWITSPISHVSHEFAPLVIAFIGLIYAVGFFFVYKVTNVYTSFLVYGGVALGMLTTAIMLELSGRSETVALLLIGLGITIFTYYLSQDEKITKIVSFFNVLPLIYVFASIARISWVTYTNRGSDDVWKDLFVVGLAIVIYFVLYGYFLNKIKDLSNMSLAVGLVLSIIGLWQVLHLVIGGGFATFMSILVYTVVGLSTLFQGTQEKNETKIRLSKLWLGLVAARVIFWDAWQVGDVVLGVLICIVIGILLLSSTFIIKKVATE